MSDDFNWSARIEADIVGYQSPIDVIMGDLQMKMDGECLKAVQSYGFNVNKDELAKALKFDRDQYHKGFNDAKAMFKRPDGSWKSEGGFVFCDQCGASHGVHETDFCPHCGADMRKYILGKLEAEEARREAYREAMRLDDNEDTLKWRGHA